MALAHCILGKFLGVVCHCFSPPLDVPTFSARERPVAAEGGTLRGREMFLQILSRIRLPLNSRDLLHAANLRHGTDGFTSPPKEGVLRIFFSPYYHLLKYLLFILKHPLYIFTELAYISVSGPDMCHLPISSEDRESPNISNTVFDNTKKMVIVQKVSKPRQ